MKSLLVIAGEVSGDMHAAGVVRTLRAEHPELQVFGIGGDRLREAGMEILVDAREMAVLGLWEVLKRYRFLKEVFDRLVNVAAERRPDAVLLVDYPGFNLRFAKVMKQLGIRVIYYVCPQVWAWHRSRIPKMAQIIDRLLVIFPFEVEVFAGTGLHVDYVGHPLVDEAQQEKIRTPVPLAWGGQPRLALLPGSRRQEVERLLPVMASAAHLLKDKYPNLAVVVAAASPEMAELIRQQLDLLPGGSSSFVVIVGATRQILREATAAMVKSGTSTLEAALMGCPMIVVYRTAAVTYHLGRHLVKVPYLGMANLILGREAFREYLQDAAQPQALAHGIAPLLGDTPEREFSAAATAEVAHALGGGGAAVRAAHMVWEEISRS